MTNPPTQSANQPSAPPQANQNSSPLVTTPGLQIDETNVNITDQSHKNDFETMGDGQTEANGGDNVSCHRGADDVLDKDKNASQTDDVEGLDCNDQDDESAAGVGAASISDRKRARNGDPIHAGSSRGLQLPSSPPACYLCNKPFGTWKEVFGHHRAHHRLTPGAFPPPTFTPPAASPEPEKDNEALKEQLAPTLLSLARQTIAKMMTMRQDSNTAGVGVSSSSSSSSLSSSRPRRGLDIDLNEPRFILDLNFEPPPEEEDGAGADAGAGAGAGADHDKY